MAGREWHHFYHFCHFSRRGHSNEGIFYSLGHDHFNALSKRLKIGQHAVLVKMWENVSGNFFSRPHPLYN